jgi:hypothetical protein
MDIYFRDIEQEKCYTLISGFLKALSIPYYVESSKSFGHSNSESGLNVFVCLNEGQKIKISKILSHYGFVSTEKTHHNRRMVDDLQFQNTEHSIQVTNVKNSVFQLNKTAHKRIKDKINLDKNIIPFLKTRKEYEMAGNEMWVFLKFAFRL